MEQDLEYNDILVDHLRSQLSIGQRLEAVPDMIHKILITDAWRHRVNRATGEIVEFGRFVEFVQTPPTDGLGADPKKIQRLLTDRPDVLDEWTHAVTGKAGGDKKSDEYQTNSDIVTNDSDGRGNASTYALRKLRKDAPQLHEQVIDGELSAHAAMVQAGFRVKTVTVPLDVERAAGTLRRHFDRNQIAELIDLLGAADGL